MSKTFTKNAILCGEIDYFCLLCDEALDCKSDVESHILWENHRKSLKSITYFSKFKDDFIIKIKNHYYCEICNSVMPTVMKTNLHIKDEKHIQHKQYPEGRGHHHPTTTPVKRNGSSITISKMSLSESEWNGIVDNQCVLCDIELENIEEHMKSQIHMINLVQSKIEKNTEFFRKIGTDSFFCFTCKEAVLLTEMDSHWINQEHIDKKKIMETEQYCDKASGSPESFNTQFKNNLRKMFDTTKNTTNTNASAIANKLQDFQKESMNIDFEKSKATCKICKPAFTVKDIQDHIKMHKNAEIQFQSECDENKDNNQLSVESPPKLNKVVEKPSETKKKQTKYETKTLKQCAKSITFIKDVDAYWINKKIVVQRNSFKLISDNNSEYNNMKCFLCDKIFPQTQDKQHWQTSLHKERLMQAKVITSLKNEFVREFHATEFNCSLYHCGFCNELTPSYAAMEAHLKSYDHEESKHAQSVLAGMIKDMDFVADMMLFKIMQAM